MRFLSYVVPDLFGSPQQQLPFVLLRPGTRFKQLRSLFTSHQLHRFNSLFPLLRPFLPRLHLFRPMHFLPPQPHSFQQLVSRLLHLWLSLLRLIKYLRRMRRTAAALDQRVGVRAVPGRQLPEVQHRWGMRGMRGGVFAGWGSLLDVRSGLLSGVREWWFSEVLGVPGLLYFEWEF